MAIDLVSGRSLCEEKALEVRPGRLEYSRKEQWSHRGTSQGKSRTGRRYFGPCGDRDEGTQGDGNSGTRERTNKGT